MRYRAEQKNLNFKTLDLMNFSVLQKVSDILNRGCALSDYFHSDCKVMYTKNISILIERENVE